VLERRLAGRERDAGDVADRNDMREPHGQLAGLHRAHERGHRVGLGTGPAAVLEDVGQRRSVLAAAEGRTCGVSDPAPGQVAHRGHVQALHFEPAADALRVCDAALVEAALRGALVQTPAR